MKTQDRVYGEINITEPIIIDIINSQPLQRLKDVEQSGYLEPHFPGTTFKRFEHSVGVYYLLKMFGAPLEEQIAGLIHDVSHGAFSHCIDYVLSSGSEKEHTHQDNIHDTFVYASELNKIISDYGFDLSYILNDANFPLKENNLPDLCADRIDYSLRTALAFGVADGAEIKKLLSGFVVRNKQWIFENFELASKFTKLFSKLNRVYYSGLQSAVMHRTVGDYLRHALANHYIAEADLYTTDSFVLNKINQHIDKDDRLAYLFDKMNNKVEFENNPDDYEAKVYCKSRVVNPLFVDGDKIKRVSEEDLNWAESLQDELKPKEYFLKFEK